MANVLHVSAARELLPIFYMLLAIARHKPFIAQPHGMLTSRTSTANRLADLLMKPIVRRSSQIIALTETEKRQLTDWLSPGVPPIQVIGNPIAPDAHTETGSTSLTQTAPPKVVFIARLHPRKRVADFVDAARLSRTTNPEYIWTIAGPDEGDLDLVLKATTTGDVAYVGALSPTAVVDELRHASVFVLPSRDEPWGNVLLSALSLGIPVVLTESAALAPRIAAQSAGIVVADESPRALAAAVQRILSDAASASRMGENARQLALSLADPQMIREQLQDVYFDAAT